MVQSGRYAKRVSSRTWRLLRDQEFQCRGCKGQICNHNLYETDDGLVCGTCNLARLGLIVRVGEQTS